MSKWSYDPSRRAFIRNLALAIGGSLATGSVAYTLLNSKPTSSRKTNYSSGGGNKPNSLEPRRIDWDVAYEGADMRALDSIKKDGDNYLLKFLHKDEFSKSGDVVEHTAVLTPDGTGTFIQSEDWADRNSDPVMWNNVNYEAVPWLFEHPIADSDGIKEFLNAIEGDLYLEDGNRVIRNVKKMALYDGQVSKLGQQKSLRGVVQDVQNMPAGALLVKLVVPSTAYSQSLYLFGNRLYEANGLKTVNQLNISRGNVIEVDTRSIDEWGQLMPKDKQVDGALAVLTYGKIR